MLLIIHNLPASTRYADIKSLLQSKCGIQQVILDNLISEGNSKKVTVGVAEDADAAILTRKINGLFWNGQQLYIEDVRQQKAASEQPYRSLNPQPEPQAELPYSSINLAQNSSYDPMTAQQVMTPMYYIPIPAYPNAEAYGGNIMETAPRLPYRQEKVQSAYPGISGYAQNASPAHHYGVTEFDTQQVYTQPAKRSRFEDDTINQDSANENSLYNRRYDQNRDWEANRPPRDHSRDSRKAVWQTANEGPIQPEFRANVRPTLPDYRSNAGPTKPDFRPNVRPMEPDFRSTIRPEERSDFLRSSVLDKPRREFGPNIQRRENERKERSDEREIFSRRPNLDKFSKRPTEDVSRRPNDEFSRRPNDEFSRRPHEEFSKRPTERAEFSRRLDVSDRSNERQGTSQFSGRPSGREELSRRPNEVFSRRPNEEFSRRPNEEFSRRPNEEFSSRPSYREDRPRRPNEHAEFSRRPNVPDRLNERQGTNQFSGRPNEFYERHGKPSRFNQPEISRNSGFDRNERPYVSRRDLGQGQRPISISRKRKFEDFQPKSSQKAFAPPKPFREQVPELTSAPPLTEQSKEKLNKRMHDTGVNKVLHSIYDSLKLLDPDAITRRTFRQVVRERVDDLLGDKKMVTALEILEIYRAKYTLSGDKDTYKVVIERIAQIVAEQANAGKQEVKREEPVVQPPAAAAPTEMEAPTRPTKTEIRALKNTRDAMHLLSQGKVPSFPLGDKRKVAQHRKEDKLGIIPETEPFTTSALTEEIDALIQICTDELENPPEETTRTIYQFVSPEEFIGELKTIITQNLARRVTDSGLKVVRVYGRPKLPKREEIEKFLLKYGVQSLRKSDKAKMFTAAVDTYENYDKLCTATFDTPDGINVHFKPFHVAPKPRDDHAQLRKIRKRNLKLMIDRSGLNLLDKDWPAKEEAIKAREAQKQANLSAVESAVEEQNEIEAREAVKTENVTEELNGNKITENLQADLTNPTTNEDDSERDQTNTTANESNNYLHDDFHVIDEVNETDSDLECLGDTGNEVFYVDEDFECGFDNDVGVNNGNDNTAENNDVENAVGDIANDDNDDKNDTNIECQNDENIECQNDENIECQNDENIECQNDENIECQNDENIECQNDENIENQNDEIFKDGENNGGVNDANYDDNEIDDNLLDGDGDIEMGDADIDNVDVDFDELDDGDLEDY